jgi:hypothetical protein
MKSSRRNKRTPAFRARPRHSQRSPNFDSGVLNEPLIVFGGQHCHVDPKLGISLYGPYSPAGQRTPVVTTIIVGIIGPPALIADAEQWLGACRGALFNDGREPFLRPHFPGMSRDSPFRCELVFGQTWNQQIRGSDLVAAIGESEDFRRIKRVVDVYIDAIEVLRSRDPQPNVILCCMPQDVIDHCTALTKGSRQVHRPRLRPATRRARRDILVGQKFLFDDGEAKPEMDNAVEGHHNLRRGLKAVSMQYGIPTQLVWPATLDVSGRPQVVGKRQVQDLATRAWNFTTALYHKAGGSPWRLDGVSGDVCFVGISFYREVLDANPKLRTSMAQAFTAAGDGYVLRGNTFEWDESQPDRSPHLDRKSASGLIRDVLDLYQRQNQRSLPSRLVIHKTSRFSEDELNGFREASRIVPQHDFVAFGNRGIQFYRTGDYPPLRGTFVKFNDAEFALYTDGYIPYLRTYPGARVPRPLEILEHHGDSPWNVMLSEILALTKMNWNSADFSCGMPITIAFSRKVGEVLAELPAELPPRPEYRYYM